MKNRYRLRNSVFPSLFVIIAACGGGDSIGSGEATKPTCAGTFCDNFDKFKSTSWLPLAGDWATFTSTDSPPDGKIVYRQTSTDDSKSAVLNAQWTDAFIESWMKFDGSDSSSASNSIGVFLRDNGTYAYVLAVSTNGVLSLRYALSNNSFIPCASGVSESQEPLVVVSSIEPRTSGWFKLRLEVRGSKDAISLAGYLDTNGAGFPATPNVTCSSPTSSFHRLDFGEGGLFSSGNAPAQYDGFVIGNLK
jgi:hypothetical protein